MITTQVPFKRSIVKHYLVIKRNELLIYAPTWMDLRGNTLCGGEPYTVWFHSYNILKMTKL